MVGEAEKNNIFKSADISLLGVVNAIFAVGTFESHEKLMSRREHCKSDFCQNERVFILMNFYEVRISFGIFGEKRMAEKEVIDLVLLHVLIGFLLYGALNEQSIFHGNHFDAMFSN